MKKFFVIVIALALPSVVVAQQVAINEPESVVDATPSILKAGTTYEIIGDRPDGGQFHHFIKVEKVEKNRISGSVTSVNGLRTCTASYPLSGQIREDGSAIMQSPESVGACGGDRKWEIRKLPNGQFDATFVGSARMFKVVVKQVN